MTQPLIKTVKKNPSSGFKFVGIPAKSNIEEGDSVLIKKVKVNYVEEE